MTEILTESFCERCGTRYTFEAARPRVRLKGVKVLSRGLKNFVLSDDTSMDEAMAAARSETDREQTAHQLDAFHATFNFCMSCRQYTCPNCWNEVEARCLSCAPHLGHEIMPAPFPDLVTGPLMTAPVNGTNGANGVDHPVELIGVAEIEAARRDDEFDAAARLAALTAPAAEPYEEVDVPGAVEAPPAEAPVEPAEAALEPAGTVAELGAVVEPETLAMPPELIGMPEPVAEPEAVAEVDVLPGYTAAPAGPVEAVAASAATAAGSEALVIDAAPPDDVAAGQTSAPGDGGFAARLAGMAAAAKVAETVSGDDAGPSLGEKGAAQTSGLLQRFRPGQNLDAELDAYERDRAAATVAGPEPPAATPTPDTVPAPAPIAEDVVPQPVWRMVAPDPVETPPDATIPAAASGAAPTGEPQWPSRPQWPSTNAAGTSLPFLGRPVAPQGGLEALWAESNREVATSPTKQGRPANVVQPCVSCGLSLSATARFCRRCGTPQAV